MYELHTLGNDELMYYGSTIQSLSMRLAGHKRDFKKWCRYFNSYSRSIIGFA